MKRTLSWSDNEIILHRTENVFYGAQWHRSGKACPLLTDNSAASTGYLTVSQLWKIGKPEHFREGCGEILFLTVPGRKKLNLSHLLEYKLNVSF